jgi:uncharacterized protein YneF (UPF0154 family)
MLCPICKSSVDEKLGRKTILLFLLIGFIIGLFTGQLFFAWQVSPIFKDKLGYLEKSNKDIKEELKKNPPSKEEPKKKSPIMQKEIQ